MKFVMGCPPPTYIHDPAMIDGAVRRCADSALLGVDCKTLGKPRTNMNDDILVVGLSPDKDTRYFVHRKFLPAFKPVIEDAKVRKAFTNAKFNMHRFANAGARVRGQIADTIVLDWLFDEDARENKHDLRTCAADHLGLPMQPYKTLFGKVKTSDIRPGHELWDKWLDYASLNPWATRELAEFLLSKLARVRLWHDDEYSLRDLYWDTEEPQLQALYLMERRGIRVDVPYLTDLGHKFQAEMDHWAAELTRRTGHPINPGSSQQVAKLLFEDMGLPVLKRTGKGAPSTDEAVMKLLVARGVEEAQMIVAYKKAQKNKGTYCQGLVKRLHTDGHIHTTFTPTMLTGRLSCVAAWTPITTRRGFVRADQVEVGDEVWTHKGRWRPVVSTFTKGIDQMYDVRLSNGKVLTCTLDHRLLLADGEWRTLRGCVQELGIDPGERGSSNPPVPNCAEGASLLGLQGRVLAIVAIRPCSRLLVYDFEVAEDHSYESCGVFSHNSKDPNLQNIPSRLEAGQKIRQAFIADEGHVLFGADYSQLEFRILAILSGDPGMVEAYREGTIDMHCDTASRMYGIPYDEFIHKAKVEEDPRYVKMRTDAKAIGFGIVYGKTAYGLAMDWGCSKEEAQPFIDKFLDARPGVRAWLDTTLKSAREDGYVQTMTGRFRRLGDINSSQWGEKGHAERQAANSRIQGSAADVVKMAMICCDTDEYLTEELGCQMLLQVHDELLFQAPEETVDECMAIVGDYMEVPFGSKLPVPLAAKPKKIQSWRDLK